MNTNRKYEVGQIINEFKIIGLATKERPGYYKIECKCGNIFNAPPRKLNERIGCEKCFAHLQEPYRYKYSVGEIIGHSKLISYNPEDGLWLALCSCGKEYKCNPKEIIDRKYSVCGDCPRQRPVKTSVEALYSITFRHYQRAAKNRNYSFELSLDEFKSLVKSPCHYCNRISSNKVSNKLKTRSIEINGIDRKDNNLGYTKENSLACCCICNRAKLTTGYDDFLLWIEKVYKYRCNDYLEREYIQVDGSAQHPLKDDDIVSTHE